MGGKQLPVDGFRLPVKGTGNRSYEIPVEYEKMRDTFVGQGMNYRDAQKKAARIYNARRTAEEKAVGRAARSEKLKVKRGKW